MFEVICLEIGSVTMLFTAVWSSPLWKHSLCVLLIGNIFLFSPQLLLGLVSLIYAPFSLESKRSKRLGFITLCVC